MLYSNIYKQINCSGIFFFVSILQMKYSSIQLRSSCCFYFSRFFFKENNLKNKGKNRYLFTFIWWNGFSSWVNIIRMSSLKQKCWIKIVFLLKFIFLLMVSNLLFYILVPYKLNFSNTPLKKESFFMFKSWYFA